MFFVSVQGGHAPVMPHPTFMAANAEAERLAAMPNNKDKKIMVLRLEATYLPTQSHTYVREEHEGD